MLALFLLLSHTNYVQNYAGIISASTVHVGRSVHRQCASIWPIFLLLSHTNYAQNYTGIIGASIVHVGRNVHRHCASIWPMFRTQNIQHCHTCFGVGLLEKRSQRDTCVHHFLGDFLVISRLESEEHAHSLSTLLRWTEWLGFPMEQEKLEGLSTTLTFLGIEIDSNTVILCLSNEKTVPLRTLIISGMGCQWCQSQSCSPWPANFSMHAR